MTSAKFNFQKLFKLLTFILLSTVAYWVYVVYMWYHEAHKTKPDYLDDYPVFSEIILFPFCSAFALFAFKHQILNVARPILSIVGKDKNDKELFDSRVYKASLAFYKVIYYFMMTVWGYIIIKDTNIFPKWLGGNGAIAYCFTNYPY